MLNVRTVGYWPFLLQATYVYIYIYKVSAVLSRPKILILAFIIMEIWALRYASFWKNAVFWRVLFQRPRCIYDCKQGLNNWFSKASKFLKTPNTKGIQYTLLWGENMSIQWLFHEPCPLIIGKNMILNLYGTKSNLQKIHPKPNYGWLSCHSFEYPGRAGLQNAAGDKNVRSFKRKIEV